MMNPNCGFPECMIGGFGCNREKICTAEDEKKLKSIKQDDRHDAEVYAADQWEQGTAKKSFIAGRETCACKGEKR